MHLLTPAAPQVTFHNPVRYGLKKELFIAAEGMYSGQVRAAQRAELPHLHTDLESGPVLWEPHGELHPASLAARTATG